MTHPGRLHSTILILTFAFIKASCAEPTASPNHFPKETVPATQHGGKRILHSDDFSTDSLGYYWGTAETTAEISNGTLKARRDEGSKGKYKVSVEPFTDAQFSIRFRLHDAAHFLFGMDDLSIKDTVHGGHLLNCRIATDSISFTDALTGHYNPEHYPKFLQAKKDKKAKKMKDFPPELQAILDANTKTIPCQIEQNRWYDLSLLLEGDKISVSLDGKTIASYQSPGFAHPRKDMYRFTMGGTVEFDEVNVIALD